MESGSERVYLEGNEAVAYGALSVGLNAFFGYPITPSTEIAEALAKEFGSPAYPRFKAFLQASSEIEAVNMALGASATGDLAMTATSSPGFSLMQEGISYAAGMELPFIVVNVNRAGPGLGSLGPEQGDYSQATRGGGHGDYRTIVLAPNSVQELAESARMGFTLAFKYRNPVIILCDSALGKVKEDILLPPYASDQYETSWAVRGAGGARRIINSLNLDPSEQEAHEEWLQKKYSRIRAEEPRCEEYFTTDAEVVLVSYGIASRICKAVVNGARAVGIEAGLFRPITLWPFPSKALAELAGKDVRFLVVELNAGRMVDDVRLAVEDASRVGFLGKLGGVLPTIGEVDSKMRRVLHGAVE